MKSYLVAAVQMNSRPDLQQNLAQAEDLIDLAVRQGAELIALPENFAFLGDEQVKLTQAETIAQESEKFLKRMAQRYQVTLLGGGFPVPAEAGKVYNRALLIDPSGGELARYDKVHLFDVNLPDGNTYEESATVLAGVQLPSVYPSKTFGNLGLSICYDVRFPELYRHLSQMGTEVMFIPAAFTAYTGKDHWQVLLQARAIENTCYVVAPAQTGTHGSKRKTYGHSLIIDPWGDIMAEADTDTGIIWTEISPDRLREVRNQIPSLEHRIF